MNGLPGLSHIYEGILKAFHGFRSMIPVNDPQGLAGIGSIGSSVMFGLDRRGVWGPIGFTPLACLPGDWPEPIIGVDRVHGMGDSVRRLCPLPTLLARLRCGQYGHERRPQFVEESYREAVREAARQHKFMMVYLHSPLHQDTPHFCRCASMRLCRAALRPVGLV